MGRRTNKFIERQKKNTPGGLPRQLLREKIKITKNGAVRPKVNPKPTGTKRPKKTKKSYG